MTENFFGGGGYRVMRYIPEQPNLRLKFHSEIQILFQINLFSQDPMLFATEVNCSS